MATLKYIINKNPNKKGKHFIYLRITHKRKPTSIKTGIAVFYEEWIAEVGRIKKIKNGSENIGRLNSKLNKLQERASEVIEKLEEKNKLQYTSVSDLRKKILGTRDRETVFNFFGRYIDKIKEFNSINTRESYNTALSSLKKFCNQNDLYFEEIDYNFLVEYKKWFRNKGITNNGCASKFDILKTIINEARKINIVNRDYTPFEHFKIQRDLTEKRAITINEIEKIRNLNLKKGTKLALARDIFMISYYCGGMPFIDLAKLKYTNIHEGYIYYNRSKTKALITIPIFDKLDDLLAMYINSNSSSEYIFPFITSNNPVLIHKEYKKAMRSYNYFLGKIGETCNLKKILTSYVARHSFATAMLNDYEASPNLVKGVMGHRNLAMTENYIDKVNKENLNLVFQKL